MHNSTNVTHIFDKKLSETIWMDVFVKIPFKFDFSNKKANFWSVDSEYSVSYVFGALPLAWHGFACHKCYDFTVFIIFGDSISKLNKLKQFRNVLLC